MSTAVGQLLFVGFEGLEAPPELLARIGEGELGGVILFQRNLRDVRQVRALTSALRAAAPADAPLLVGVDQEGGRVQRLRPPLGVNWPPMRRLGERDDLELTEAVGRAIGEDLASLGFNVDFAPVLDVVSEPENTVIGDRAFGAEAARVTGHALAFARGLTAAGVLPCGKHFPGHGGPVADSHVTLPREQRSASTLHAVDLVPFVQAARANLPLLMTAHVIYEALDPAQVATFSPAICEQLLREQLGYQGVLISDDLEMAAVAAERSTGQAALAALRAGVDMLLICHAQRRQHEAHAALITAARGAEATRVAQAASRVAALKARLAPARALPDGPLSSHDDLREAFDA